MSIPVAGLAAAFKENPPVAAGVLEGAPNPPKPPVVVDPLVALLPPREKPPAENPVDAGAELPPRLKLGVVVSAALFVSRRRQGGSKEGGIRNVM